MSVLLSKPAQEVIQNLESISLLSIQQIISRLEAANISGLEKDSSIRRINDTEEEIYIMRFNNLRVFFTRKEKDIVLLSIEYG